MLTSGQMVKLFIIYLPFCIPYFCQIFQLSACQVHSSSTINQSNIQKAGVSHSLFFHIFRSFSSINIFLLSPILSFVALSIFISFLLCICMFLSAFHSFLLYMFLLSFFLPSFHLLLPQSYLFRTFFISMSQILVIHNFCVSSLVSFMYFLTV